jgi:hypothetical protein
MEFFIPRKLMFKAWNTETKLLMRLNSIDCKRGELYKKDHILLQFTGFYDKLEDEIYEMDVVMISHEKFVVVWDPVRTGWNLARLSDRSPAGPFLKENSVKASRLWSYFESERKE